MKKITVGRLRKILETYPDDALAMFGNEYQGWDLTIVSEDMWVLGRISDQGEVFRRRTGKKIGPKLVQNDSGGEGVENE